MIGAEWMLLLCMQDICARDPNPGIALVSEHHCRIIVTSTRRGVERAVSWAPPVARQAVCRGPRGEILDSTDSTAKE